MTKERSRVAGGLCESAAWAGGLNSWELLPDSSGDWDLRARCLQIVSLGSCPGLERVLTLFPWPVGVLMACWVRAHIIISLQLLCFLKHPVSEGSHTLRNGRVGASTEEFGGHNQSVIRRAEGPSRDGSCAWASRLVSNALIPCPIPPSLSVPNKWQMTCCLKYQVRTMGARQTKLAGESLLNCGKLNFSLPCRALAMQSLFYLRRRQAKDTI